MLTKIAADKRTQVILGMRLPARNASLRRSPGLPLLCLQRSSIPSPPQPHAEPVGGDEITPLASTLQGTRNINLRDIALVEILRNSAAIRFGQDESYGWAGTKKTPPSQGKLDGVLGAAMYGPKACSARAGCVLGGGERYDAEAW